jgi:dipeptidyl-peptidase-3
MAIDDTTLKQYLADSPPTVVALEIKQHFEALNEKEKLYSHHLSVYAPLPAIPICPSNWN